MEEDLIDSENEGGTHKLRFKIRGDGIMRPTSFKDKDITYDTACAQ